MDQVLSLVPGQNTTLPATVLKIEIKAGAQADFSAFRLFKNNLVEKDEDFVFYGQPATSDGSISLSFTETSAVFALDLAKLEPSVTKVALGVTTDLPNISRLGTLHLTARAHDSTVFRCPLDNLEQNREKALILCEFYKYNGVWKFRFVAQGFRGGLPEMAEHYGVELDDDSKPKEEEPTSSQTQTQPNKTNDSSSGYQSSQSGQSNRQNSSQSRLSSRNTSGQKVELTQQQPKVILSLGSQQPDFFKITLNSKHSAGTAGLWSSLSAGEQPKAAINDIDLGAYVKLKDGTHTIVQALGQRFGSFSSAPFVQLVRENAPASSQRSLSNQDESHGEYLSINPEHVNEISEIVIFTFFYNSIPTWNESAGVIHITLAGQPEVTTNFNDGDNSLALCAIARLTNVGNSFQVERVDRYFNGHADMDSFFGWGFTWVPGTKD